MITTLAVLAAVMALVGATMDDSSGKAIFIGFAVICAAGIIIAMNPGAP